MLLDKAPEPAKASHCAVPANNLLKKSFIEAHQVGGIMMLFWTIGYLFKMQHYLASLQVFTKMVYR